MACVKAAAVLHNTPLRFSQGEKEIARFNKQARAVWLERHGASVSLCCADSTKDAPSESEIDVVSFMHVCRQYNIGMNVAKLPHGVELLDARCVAVSVLRDAHTD